MFGAKIPARPGAFFFRGGGFSADLADGRYDFLAIALLCG
jgi:hypothetical protein